LSFLETCWRELQWIAAKCWGRLGCTLRFSLAFKALNLILLTPLAAGILRFCLSLWGRASVGNFELARFFLSPAGLAALLLVGSILIASFYFELVGLVRLLADSRLRWWETLRSSTGLLPRLAWLGLVQVSVFLALAVPFLLGIGCVYWWFWSGKDLNGLVIVRPPEFWWGAGIAALIAAAYVSIAVWLVLRQLYAALILTLEAGFRPREALRESARRSRTTKWRSAAALATWFVAQTALGVAVFGGLDAVVESMLRRSGASIAMLVAATGVALAIQLVVATLWSVLTNITLAGVIYALYRHKAPVNMLAESATTSSSKSAEWSGWKLAAGFAIGLMAAMIVSGLSLHGLVLHDDLEITAHRAGATNAPENTVAALRQAIADGADWAEIDVQLTADNQIVVMHDIDLARVGGGQQRVDRSTLAEIQSLDVGRLFGPAFAGERIPTLRQIIDAAGDDIRLNVELKPHGKEDVAELTRRVLAELSETKVLPRCHLCSQSYESLQLARELEPELPLGYIVATSVGDPTKLDVDFLMVKSNLATRRLVNRGSLRGIAIHAWTVNDPGLVAPLLDAGTANLITDDPARMRQQLDIIRSLSTPERLLLRVGHALAQ
jgi:glycerophosphoryl diester phosphodiesterase